MWHPLMVIFANTVISLMGVNNINKWRNSSVEEQELVVNDSSNMVGSLQTSETLKVLH